MFFVAIYRTSCPLWTQPSLPQEHWPMESLRKTATIRLKGVQRTFQWDAETECMAQMGIKEEPNQNNQMDPRFAPFLQESHWIKHDSNHPTL